MPWAPLDHPLRPAGWHDAVWQAPRLRGPWRCGPGQAGLAGPFPRTCAVFSASHCTACRAFRRIARGLNKQPLTSGSTCAYGLFATPRRDGGERGQRQRERSPVRRNQTQGPGLRWPDPQGRTAPSMPVMISGCTYKAFLCNSGKVGCSWGNRMFPEQIILWIKGLCVPYPVTAITTQPTSSRWRGDVPPATQTTANPSQEFGARRGALAK